MDSLSATSNIPKKAPRNLNRAKACGHCRRRKTKCDAKRPHCSQCLARRKPGIEIVCEYPIVGRTRKRTLEESISTLEKRIRELERAEPDEDAVKLYDPSIYPLPSISSPLTHSESPTSSTSLLLDASIPESSLYTATEYQEDIPIALGQRLLSAFVPHARTFGFFLNLSRFLSSMTLPPAPGDSSRPCRGLMCSVYLLGLHFTGASADEESVFLSKTLWHVSNVLSADHPLRLIHGAQAEILLCNYFFRTGRIVEGKYHLSSAVNLCACAGLNKVRSGNMDTVFSSSSLMGIGGSVLPEPQDLVDEGERINAFWTAFTLCNIWGVWVGGGISMIFESLGFQIDTPWPLDMEDYEESRIPPNYTGALTVRKFLSETPPSQHALSKTAWFAQSSLLLERAANMANSYRNELHPDDHARYMNAFTSLDRLIDSFHASLPHFSQTPTSSPDFVVVWMTHQVCYAATIRLHSAFASSNAFSRKKAIASAESCILSARGKDMSYVEVNPIFGMIWKIIGDVIVDEAVRLDRINSQTPSVPNWGVEGRVMGRRVEIVALLEELFLMMEIFARTSKIIAYQLNELREQYRSRCI